MRNLLIPSLVVLSALLIGCYHGKYRPIGVAPSAAKQPTEEELKAQIDKLLALMASDKFKDREEATQNLRNLLKQSCKKKKVLAQYLKRRFEEAQDTDTRLRLEPILDQYLRPWECFEKLHILKAEGWPFVYTIAFSPDGKFVACGTCEYVPGSETEVKDVVLIWDTATGRLLHSLEGHEDRIHSVVFSPDSKTLASGGSDGLIKIWDIQTGRVIHTLSYKVADYDSPLVTSVAFSPDGKLLAAGHWVGIVTVVTIPIATLSSYGLELPMNSPEGRNSNGLHHQQFRSGIRVVL
jgi:hypothetical protein